MAQIVGQRSTAQIISEARNVRDVAPKIFYLEPDKQPLITFLNKLNKKKACYSTKYTWFESDYCARWTTMGATTGTTGDTALVVTDGTLFKPGDMFVVPKVVTSATAPELIRVVSISTNTLTVVRAQGGTSATTIGAGAALTFAGTAYEEGAALPAMRSTIPVEKTSYTQIFRTVINLTNTSRATKVYGLDELQRLRFEKAAEHKISINRAFLFGGPGEDLTGGATGNPIRTTQGLLGTITTNVFNANGTLTRGTIERFSQMAFRYGSSEKVLLASPTVISAINQFAQQHLMISPNEKVMGVNVNRMKTGHGDFLLVRDWMLEDGVSALNGFAGNALALDLDQIQIRYLNENGVNRDTKYLEDVIQDGGDRRADEYLSEIGQEIHNEKYHARLYNVTGWAA